MENQATTPRLNRLQVLYRLFMLAVLSYGAVFQVQILYQHWLEIPRQDINAWRLEYAEIDLSDLSGLADTQTDSPTTSNPNTSNLQDNSEEVIPSPDQTKSDKMKQVHQLSLQLRAGATDAGKNLVLPNIEILLTDLSGQEIAYRELSPKEWLGTMANEYLVKGAPSQTQFTVEIPLEIPENASGFQVQMLYP